MSFIQRPKLHKIPGGGMPLAKKDCYAKDLTKLRQMDLLEIKEREEKILQNKLKLQKLPDKGQRIQIFYEKVLKELERRSNVDEAVNMFSKLNIAFNGKAALNELEWQGNLKSLQNNTESIGDVLDSDDEAEINPLKIIAQRQMHEKKTKMEPLELKLINNEDLKEIESFNVDCSASGSGTLTHRLPKEALSENVVDHESMPKLQQLNSANFINVESRSDSVCSHTLDLEPHVYYLVDKTESQVHQPVKEKYKPYRTTVSNVHDPAKERQRKRGKHWEVTAATPPPIQFNGTQLINLIDSVDIQSQYLLKLKELQEKQAAERLAAKLKRLEDRKIYLPPEEELKTKDSFTKYRSSKTSSNVIEGDQKLNEQDEAYDPLEEEKFDGVNYTVYN